MFQQRRPSPALAPFVALLWYAERPPSTGTERVLPTGRGQLIVDVSSCRAIVVGPTTRATTVPSHQLQRTAGVAFHPAAGPLVDLPYDALRDQVVPLEALWGPLAKQLEEQIHRASSSASILDAIDAALAQRLQQWHAPPAPVRAGVAYAVRALEAGQRVRAVIDTLGWSRATFQRRFGPAVGMSAKQWASVARFQHAVRELAGGATDLAQLAIDSGYYDQAHLSHAFRQHAGMSPKAYRPVNADEPNHVGSEDA